MKRIGFALLAAVVAYPVGGFAGGVSLYLASSNAHDRGLEASMTGAFVCGPLAAAIAYAAAWRRGRAVGSSPPLPKAH